VEPCEVECPSPNVFSFFVAESWMLSFLLNNCGFGLAGMGLKITRLSRMGLSKVGKMKQ
jgi:hypothetical protein